MGGVACPPTKTVPAARKAAPKPKRAAGTTPSGWRLQKRSACTGAPAVGAVAWPEPNQARHVVPPRLQQRVAAPALHTQLRARQGALQAGPLLSAGDKQVLVCNLLGAGGGGGGGRARRGWRRRGRQECGDAYAPCASPSRLRKLSRPAEREAAQPEARRACTLPGGRRQVAAAHQQEAALLDAGQQRLDVRRALGQQLQLPGQRLCGRWARAGGLLTDCERAQGSTRSAMGRRARQGNAAGPAPAVSNHQLTAPGAVAGARQSAATGAGGSTGPKPAGKISASTGSCCSRPTAVSSSCSAVACRPALELQQGTKEAQMGGTSGPHWLFGSGTTGRNASASLSGQAVLVRHMHGAVPFPPTNPLPPRSGRHPTCPPGPPPAG